MSAAPSPDLRDHPVMSADILRGFHLLEADAGTGKTWTLSGLVVRALVERALGIDRILVVTFTNAATAELAGRIRERIGQLARLLEDREAGRETSVSDPFCVAYAAQLADPAAALRLLRVALAQVDEAAVRTIHAFCHRVIAEHSLSIGVRADAPATEGDGAWIRQGVAGWWRARVENAAPAELALLRAAGIAPSTLEGLVAELDGLPGARVEPAPADWRALARRWSDLRERLAEVLEADVAALHAFIAVKGQANGQRFKASYLHSRAAVLRAFCAGRGGAMPEEISRFTTEYFEGDAGKHRAPSLAMVGLCDALWALAPQLAELPAQLALDAWSELREHRAALKARDGALDHDDLLRVVHDALARESSGAVLAASLRERHPLALVDECQDTDALQWEIFRRIYLHDGDRAQQGLILVGDPKQAIYAFRAADVYSYLGARAQSPARHALHENQRSVRPLIQAVNALFHAPGSFLVPEIDFSPSGEGRKPRRAFTVRPGTERPSLSLLMLPGEGDRMLPAWQARDVSARAAVAEIARLLTPGAARLDDRPLKPSDVAVLVNSHQEGSQVKRALAQAGIGAIEISRESVLDSPECGELMRVIAAIADPADAGLVKSALATTMAGLDAAALSACAQGDAAFARIVDALAEARRDWSDGGPQAALRRWLLAMGAGPRLAGLRDGERRLTNLAHLLELLGAHPEPREGAAAALRWLARMRADPAALGRDAGELRLESDEDLVRIVTVHKSKGLEFPVVFVPFAWSGREARSRGALRYHEEAGGDWRQVLDLRAAPDATARERAAREQYAEGLRALYVALTRAEHRCYVVWGAGAGAQFSPLAWLLAGLDPTRQVAWRSNSKEPPALAPAVARQGALRWHAAAAALHPDAVGVVDAQAVIEAGPVPDVDAPDAGTDSDADSDADAGGTPARDNADTLAPPPARPFTARIAAPWIRTSFTGLGAALLRGGAPESARVGAERPDHDQGVEPPDAPAEPAGDVRFAFPAGAQAGVCLHGILEHTDFTRGVQPADVALWLARTGHAGRAGEAGGPGAVDPAAVARWLDAVLGVALPDPDGGGFTLARLARSATIREMEFHLAAHDVDNARLVDAVGAHYPLDAQAARSRWSGFLRGFVDLVVEHDRRYFIVDWKSNHLGALPQRYAPAALAADIGANAYALQFCLYALALHRMLRLRLPGYDYQRHVGGVHYVYLRGAGLPSPDPAAPVGVYATRPPLALIDALDRLLGGTP